MPDNALKDLKVRRWKKADIPALVECQRAAYPYLDTASLHDERKLGLQLAAFPEGQFLAEVDGKVIGYCTSLIVQIDEGLPWYSYDEITGAGAFGTHDPAGDSLYGSDIAVHPDYRGQGVAAALYRRRKALLKRLNLRRMIAGGRIPGYREHAKRLTARQYVQAVQRGELKDPALSAHLKAGYQVRGVHYAYLNDAESMNYATLLELDNPRFDPARRLIAGAPIRKSVRKVRVCAAQYHMRPLADWQQFEYQVEFFTDAANEYHCHFLLMPEMFTAQLFSLLPKEIESIEAVKRLAEFTDRYRELCLRLANKHGLYLIGGSHPALVNENELRNRAYLFTPSGEVYWQDKLHITSVERLHYGMQPGDELKVFDTPFGRIGILICYDVEFPELTRLLVQHGIEVLFVPFAVYERKGYHRVRYCAQARAVENVIYVVLAGSVGNLPQVRSFLINYAQSAICTPCDFAFPKDGILAEAEPNVETVVIGELDLNDLAVQRDIGSVLPLQDRRDDIYETRAKIRVEVVTVR